ncbi:MAG: hypothetical protein AVDCRST_MAG93-344, partial [uncultured Chloroflexia bacterium]
MLRVAGSESRLSIAVRARVCDVASPRPVILVARGGPRVDWRQNQSVALPSWTARVVKILRLLVVILALSSFWVPDVRARQTHPNVLAAQASDDQATTVFRGNPGRTGEQPGPGPAGDPVLKWRAFTRDDVLSSPTVANGSVYIGSNDNHLYAFNTNDGSRRWRFATKNDVASSPAVSNSIVYVGSFDGNLYAIDATDGTERWRFAVGSTIFSSPVVESGTVYVGAGDGVLYALDATSGAVRWRVSTGGPLLSSPAVIDGVVFIGSVDGVLYAVNAASGTERWRFDTGSIIYATPAVADGVAHVASFGG